MPIGIGPYCNRNDWTGCSHLGALVTQQSVSTTDTAVTTANVTPAWQKFTVTNNTGIGSVFIGGLGQTTNQKIYAWGARVEKSQ